MMNTRSINHLNFNSRPSRLEVFRDELLRKPASLAILAGATAVALYGYAQQNQNKELNRIGAEQRAEQNPICVPEGSQKYTFDIGEGINDAVYAIEGAGAGMGAACFDDATEIVQKAAKTEYNPQANQTIVIPRSIHPVDSR